jgi:phage-related baseplate assembly protein
MTFQIKKKIKKQQNRTFLARDFESLRSQLLDTARTYFPDKIQDFSEPSVGGMFLDFAATVGDSLSFYMDHAFRELDPIRAVESDNIITHLRNSGVEIVGASPAVVSLKFTITVPSEEVSGVFLPKRSAMPVILAGTRASSFSGVSFTTTEDIDFSEKDLQERFVADYVVSATDSSTGQPVSFKVSREVIAVSGEIRSESLDVPDTFIPFREITLSERSITSILSIIDTESNEYYEVSSLSEDTVFLKTKNQTSDASQVPYFIRVIAAPRRFTRSYSPTNQLTTIRFGSGDAETLDDDIVPDPSDLSLNLFGKTVVPRFSIDPASLLNTQTLGISPKGTTLSVRYRYGGGLSHNVATDSINSLDSVSLSFRRSPDASDALTVRQSISVTNLSPASGGDSAPSLDDLKTRITTARKSQRRVVSREDLLARLYTLPSEFGRVYRASISDNPVNPNSSLVYILSRDQDGNLGTSPDSLKKNISTYLNELRLVGDAVDILDGKIINFAVKYSVFVADTANKNQVITNINSSIASIMSRKFFNIDQPIILDDITNVIINTDFVISLVDLQVFPRAGQIEDRVYSTSTFDFKESQTNGVIMPDRGSIFELKFPDSDIIGTAV